MTRIEPLNPRDHGGLRLRNRLPPDPGFPLIVPAEFAAAAAACPILFSKDPETGRFYAGALLGFKPGESFLGDIRARTDFEPLSLQRDGFFVSGEHMMIDRDNPRFSELEGEPLFDDALQPGLPLRQMQRVISQLQSGLEASDLFIRQLLELKLIEPVDIDAKFDNGEKLVLEGLYTISLDRLQSLEDASVLALFRNGYLQLIHVVAGSLCQISTLAKHRNAVARSNLPT